MTLCSVSSREPISNPTVADVVSPVLECKPAAVANLLITAPGVVPQLDQRAKSLPPPPKN